MHLNISYIRPFIFGLLLVISICGYSQSKQIKGRVTDADTGEGMPFVNVFFNKTSIGSTTDFDGYYTISTSSPADSLVASYIGYIPRTKAVIKSDATQVIDFQLSSSELKLDEVVVIAGENPAFPIMRNVIKNKIQNDKKSLTAYEYQSYNKIELDIDHLSEKFRKNKTMQKITQVMDSIERIAGEEGKPILPIFISESISDNYYRRNPQKRRELIQKTNVMGIGMQDGSLISQLVGSSFQEYNFYNNWLNMLEKDFISPIADGWKAFYEYALNDSLYVGEHWCYQIDFKPKRAQDLAFTGTIWIDSKTFALKQIDVSMGKGANLNFVEKIKIQQELEPTTAKAWLPVRTRVLIDMAEVREESPGMLAKFYTSNKNIRINQPHELRFYDIPLELAEDAREKTKSYWYKNRHDSLTSTEKNVYIMIDSVRNIPTVKTYLEILNIAINGYIKAGPVDIGPYVLAYGLNSVEGHRLQVGFKTNADFSRKWIFKGYAAYGTKDTRIKYNAEIQRIISRKPWTIVGLKRRYDLERIGLLTDDIYDNTLLLTAARFGTLRRPFMSTENIFYAQTDIRKGFTQRIKFRHMQFDPLYNFTYFKNPREADTSPLLHKYTNTELVLETRITKDETFLQNDNERISLGTYKPVLTLQYSLGLKSILGSDFNYQKFSISAAQNVRMGIMGRASYTLNAAYIPSPLPYPLLFNHQGNQTYFYNASSYNLMNYFEFSSDKYISLNYQHNFEGLMFNRIPLLKKLKWRLLATANVLKGSLRDENLRFYPLPNNQTATLSPIQPLGTMPYVEVGYGIENIFKFIRLDAVHRLTYLQQPGARRFGIFVTTQFKL